MTIAGQLSSLLNSNGVLTVSTITSTSIVLSGQSILQGITATAITGTNLLVNGSSSLVAATVQNIVETANVIVGAPTSVTTASISNGAVIYYTSTATTNWTLNATFSSGNTTMNSVLAVGQVLSFVVLATQGSTAYYNTAVQVDGTTSTVTTYWQNGTAPTKGYASGIDAYSYTIIKTASAPTYTVLASQTQF